MQTQRVINSPVPTFADLPPNDLPGTVRQVTANGTPYRCVYVQWLPEDGQGNLSPVIVDPNGNPVAGVSTLAWTNITGKPTTLPGYGITDPIALTNGSYANPAWITTLAWSKLTGTPTTLSGYGITDAGFLGIPQNSKSAAYTTVLGDAGKHILHPSADTTARTFTIDSNANVAYPVGTAITFINQHSAGVVTIAITSDTMRLAGAGTTGSRTLAADGIATAVKVTATEWIISGTGLT